MESSRNCPVIRIDPTDNIVVARQSIAAGTFIPEEGITVKTDIPIGHKIASRAISHGEPVRKYNTIIGYAARDVDAGIHMHNDTIYFDVVSEEYHFCQDYHPVKVLLTEQQRTSLGYVRPDGRIGNRNCIGIIVCGNCAATVARKIASHFTQNVMVAYTHVDAVIPLITSSGCGLEKSGTPLAYLRRGLGGHVKNSNMEGALVCALGDGFFREAGLTPGPMLGRLVIQDEDNSRKAVVRGIAIMEAMLPLTEQCRRQPVPVSNFKVGLECGGSDSFSGVSANPALGLAMDRLIQNSGTAVLTEPTELLGAEGALTHRVYSPEVARKLIMDYCKGRDSQINGKVTPGNNVGGITNVLEKALGSTQKGGESLP